MTKVSCAFKNEVIRTVGRGQEARSIIPKNKIERRFRDDGCCPECFAEMVFEEGVLSCHLCGYFEAD